ncbi:MAG: RNA methyltransferase [Candidatus Omnitrophota bacterium]
MQTASRAQLKEIRELMREKRSRDETGLFVAEGEKIVRDMLAKKNEVCYVLAARSFLSGEEGEKGLFLKAPGQTVPLFEIDDKSFETISSLRNSQGILAVAKKRTWANAPAGSGRLSVLCDGLQDPGNLGTIIRTSAALGADRVLLSGETADAYNPKVVRASAGAVLDIPICICSPGDIDRLKAEGYSLLVSRVTEEGAEDISKIRTFPKKCILAFGAEGSGVSPEISVKADMFFSVPMNKTIESLNVTAAAAIAIYLVTRGTGEGNEKSAN